MSETNGFATQHPSPMMTCEPNSINSQYDNNISEEPEDTASPRRVMIVTAAAGALTAAAILIGWGMNIERNEAQILRAALSAPTAQTYSRFSFFRQIDDDRNQAPTDAVVSAAGVNQNMQTRNNDNQAKQTIRVEQLKFLNEQLRKYARKRVQLERIMLKLRAFEVKRKQQARNRKTESVLTGAQLTEEAQYRTRLREAANLRDELQQLRIDSSAAMYLVNQAQPQYQSISSRPFRSDPRSNETGQLNDNNVPQNIIMVNSNTPSQPPVTESFKPDLRNMTINKRAQYHTHQLIARLEETRLNLTTRLAAVTWTDNQPVR